MNRNRRSGFYSKYGKRMLDILVAASALLVLSPLFLILSLLVRVYIGTPILFQQLRPGFQRRIFCMKKYRSMSEKKNEKGELLPDEERLLPFGRFLRETSLDELPELFSILKGDLSIVGPRPQLVKDMVFMNERQLRRHEVPQGLTGLAQVRGRNSLSWEDKLESDVEYVEHFSFWLDVKIVFQTIGIVLRREGIQEEGCATATNFGDYLLEKGKITKEEYQQGQKRAEELIAEFIKGKK